MIDTIATCGCSHQRCADVRSAGDDVEHARPAGPPRPRSRRAGGVDAGVCGAGLSTIVLPAASAGPSFQIAMMNGKFHGAIPATTPTGRRIDHRGVAAARARRRPEPSSERAAPAKNRRLSTPNAELAVGEDRPRLAGLAHLEVDEVVGGRRARRPPATSDRARSPGGARRPRRANAAARRATAASTSAADACANDAVTSPVAGSTSSIDLRPTRRAAPPST